MAAKTNAAKVTTPSDTEILITREFDAPATLVWKAMTTPELLKQWWGPQGSELTTCEIDLRVGGGWRYVSRNADGSEHPFKGEYREIVPGRKIVQTFIYDVPPINEFVAVENMTLAEHDGRTTLTTLVQHSSREARDGHLQSGMEGGMNETFERLDGVLRTLSA
jgi:uncharacterized protein YndB with AHSA1/START domain